MLIHGQFDLNESFDADDFITCDNLRNQLKYDNSVQYFKRDFLFKGGEWRGGRHPSFFDLRKSKVLKTVVVGHSDFHTGIRHQQLLKFMGVKKLFGVNVSKNPGFSVSVPLGLTNDCDDTPSHRMFGNSRLLFEAATALNLVKNFKPSLLINFTVTTNLSKRMELMELLPNLKQSYELGLFSPTFTYSGRFEYLAQLREYPMVLCPEGNGVDTHRLWETLYMGGIPVVLRNSSMESLYGIFPTIQLNSWADLGDLERIEELWEKAQTHVWDSRLLTASYWSAMICEL